MNLFCAFRFYINLISVEAGMFLASKLVPRTKWGGVTANKLDIIYCNIRVISVHVGFKYNLDAVLPTNGYLCPLPVGTAARQGTVPQLCRREMGLNMEVE